MSKYSKYQRTVKSYGGAYHEDNMGDNYIGINIENDEGEMIQAGLPFTLDEGKSGDNEYQNQILTKGLNDYYDEEEQSENDDTNNDFPAHQH